MYASLVLKLGLLNKRADEGLPVLQKYTEYSTIYGDFEVVEPCNML